MSLVACDCSFCLASENPEDRFIPASTAFRHRQTAFLSSPSFYSVNQPTQTQPSYPTDVAESATAGRDILLISPSPHGLCTVDVEMELLRAELHCRLSTLDFCLCGSLIFMHATDDNTHGIPNNRRTDIHTSDASSIPASLDPTKRCNWRYLELEAWLNETIKRVESLSLSLSQDPSHKAEVEGIEEDLLEALDRVVQYRQLEWDRQRGDGRKEELVVNTEQYLWQHHPKNPTLVAIFITVLTLHVLYRVARRPTKLLLAGMRDIIATIPATAGLVALIPEDPSTIIRKYDVEPRTTVYISCPSCYALYPDQQEQQHCTYRGTPDEPECGDILWREQVIKSKTYRVPRRKYLHQSLKEWLGRLLGRPDMDQLLDSHLLRQRSFLLQDIWDSPIWAHFRDRDKDLPPFMSLPGRLMFGLGMDGFNPFHMKEAKQSASSTAIYLVLFNLPPHLRYRPENLYVAGVVPGPGKPSLDEVNRSLKLVVQEMKDFWYPGIFYSRTTTCPQGRIYRAALVPVICDMLAARQVSGFSSATSTFFCTVCLLTIQDIENIDIDRWPRRGFVEHRHHAQCWRDADNSDERNSVFEKNGIRWSELLNLPYWNPSLYTVVDAPHTGYLGLFQHHCRTVWGINVEVEGGDGTALRLKNPIHRPANSVMRHWLEVIRRTEDPEQLKMALNQKNCYKNVLWHICNDHNLRHVSNAPRQSLISIVVEWRSKTPASQILLPPVHGESARYLGVEAEDTTDAEGETSDLGAESEASRTSFTSETSSQMIDQHQLKALKEVYEFDDETYRRYHQKFFEGRSKFKTLVSYKKIYLIALCDELGLPEYGKKEDLAASLIHWRRNNLAAVEKNFASGKNQRHVLGRSIMEAVYDDMKKTQLPSWVSRAPKDWGTPSRGKLAADQWKVICTVHLVITLIRIWGTQSSPESLRFSRMLANFLDMVKAVSILNLRVTSPTHIQRYNFFAKRYVAVMKVLYKDVAVKPIHHMALHAGEFLRVFGLVHAYRTLAFERLNHTMQQQNTNSKFGELEMTFLRSLCRISNVTALVNHDATVSNFASRMLKRHMSNVGEDSRGTLRGSLQSPDTDFNSDSPRKLALYPPSAPLRDRVQVWLAAKYGHRVEVVSIARVLTRIYYNGVKYESCDRCPADADIMFHQEGQTLAGEIKDIYSVTHVIPNHDREQGSITRTLLQVAPLEPANRQLLSSDLYLSFGMGFLCQSGAYGETFIIEDEQIKSHFARLEDIEILDHRYTLVYPLDKLMDANDLPQDHPLAESWLQDL